MSLTALVLTTISLSLNDVSGEVLSHTPVSQPECTNRFEFRHAIYKRRFVSCEELVHHNPLCAKDYKVAYSDYPPYVYYNEHLGKVCGILASKLFLHNINPGQKSWKDLPRTW